MARLSDEDILEIIEMLENEIVRIPKLARIETMRFRTRIRSQAGWIGAFMNPTPKKIMDKLRQRMSEFVYRLPGGLSDEFKELLDEKVRGLNKKSFTSGSYNYPT